MPWSILYKSNNKTIKNLKLDGGGTYLSQNLWPKVFFGSLSSAGGLSETRTQTSHMQYWKHQYFWLVMIFNNQTSVLLLSNILYQYGPILTDQALVVVGVDNAIHCLNLYLVDSMVIFLHTCPFKWQFILRTVLSGLWTIGPWPLTEIPL